VKPVLPSHVGSAMPTRVVRMSRVMHLEAKHVLQVVARLFLGKPRDDSRPLRDVYDHEALGFR
jgi:hypothetical protein